MNRTAPVPDKIRLHMPANVNRVRFCLSEPPVVEGLGLPFSNPGDETERWVHDDAPIVGDVTLSSIFAQEEFEFITVLVKPDALKARLSLQELGKSFKYPHADDQTWDASLERGDAGEIFGLILPLRSRTSTPLSLSSPSPCSRTTGGCRQMPMPSRPCSSRHTWSLSKRTRQDQISRACSTWSCTSARTSKLATRTAGGFSSRMGRAS